MTFVDAVVSTCGRVSDAELGQVRAVGFSDEEIVEIIAHVGINVFTNYFNLVAGTEVDFPIVDVEQACAA